MTASLYDIPLKRIDGSTASLREQAGNVMLIVNVASKCGKTLQYAGLESLYERRRDRGFAVLGFPSNQFGEQEPGTNAEIQEFCRTVYGVRFPMFAKIDVKGPSRHPLYAALTAAKPERITPPGKEPKPGPDVRWNFEKFLIGRTGAVIARFDPDVTPEDPLLLGAIDATLAERRPD